MTATKAIAAFIGSIITWLLASGTIPIPTTWQLWLGLIAALCTTVTTYALPNRPKFIDGQVVTPK